MNRTPLLVGGIVAGGAALVTGGVILTTTLLGGAPATDPYVASNVGDLRIVQQGAHSYDVSFDLPVPDDEAAAALADLASTERTMDVQLTDSPDYDAARATDLAFTVDGDRIELATVELAPGDHYVWIEKDGNRVSATVTIPDLEPRVWIADDVPTIEFGESGDSSWSSYVDPEGKNVYRGASPTFDDSVAPLAENLGIGETSYRIEDADPALPYYFLVFEGRGGDATFVSSSIFTQAEQGPLTVELTRIDGVPSYVIGGFLGSQKADVERSHALRVGTYQAGNPGSTFMVESSYEGSEPGAFRFVVPATELAEGYSDLVVFLSEDGSTLEWSLDASGVDLSERLVTDGSVFGLRRPEALQLTRLDLVYTQLDVALASANGGAQLRVSGSFTEAASQIGYQLVVKEADGERHTVDDGTAAANRFSYVFDLGRLADPGVWYDVEFLDPGTGESAPISTVSVRDMRQWVQTESRMYAFADYDGLLKVFFDASPFANARVTLATVDGVPSLVATGQLVGTGASDARLRIRTGDTVVQDVANSSTARGAFRFVFDLSRLPSADVWYDVTFFKPSTGNVRDFRAASADLRQTLSGGDRTFGFREFDGQLKVTYGLNPGALTLASADLVDVAGIPSLRLEGSLESLASSDAFLRVRSGVETFDVANTSPTAGRALFVFDLRTLTRAGTWYDLLLGSTSRGTLVDVASTGVDLAASLANGGRDYGFREWNTQLKVTFDDVSSGVAVARTELVDVAGTPTLRVTGTVAGTADADVFLRVPLPSG